MKITTVKIKHEGGYCLINQADFDSSIHELYEDAPESNKPEATDQPAPKEESQPTTVNINTASSDDLTSLQGIGKARAKQIIANRPYESLEEAQKKLPDLNWGDLNALVSV